jgi:hypothetical protein
MKSKRIVFLGWLIIVIIASLLLSVSSTYELEESLDDTTWNSIIIDWTEIDSNIVERLGLS